MKYNIILLGALFHQLICAKIIDISPTVKNVEYHSAPHQQPITSLTLKNMHVVKLLALPNGTLIGGCNTGQFIAWNPNNKHYIIHNQPAALINNTSSIQALAMINNSVFAAGDKNGNITLWDAERMEPISILTGHVAAITQLTVFDNGIFASCSQDKTIRLWNLVHQQFTSLIGHTDWVNDIVKIPNGNYLSCADDMTLKIWDPATLQCTKTIAQIGRPPATLTLFNDTDILVGSQDGSARKLNLTTWKSELCTMSHAGGINKIIVLDQNLIASCSVDHSIKLWNKAGTYHLSLKGHTGNVTDMITIGEHALASCSRDGTICLWKTDFYWPTKNDTSPSNQKENTQNR